MKTYFENDIDKTSKAVTKLLRQTQDGEILWDVDSRELFLGAEEHITGQVYKTYVLNKHLRIFKYYKFVQHHPLGDKFFDGIKLQFTDYSGKPEWEFPYSNAIKDLYDSIAFSTTKVQDFLDKLLKEQ